MNSYIYRTIYTNREVMDELFKRYNPWRFDIKLNGLEISYEVKNNFLFLNVVDKLGLLNQVIFV